MSSTPNRSSGSVGASTGAKHDNTSKLLKSTEEVIGFEARSVFGCPRCGQALRAVCKPHARHILVECRCLAAFLLPSNRLFAADAQATDWLRLLQEQDEVRLHANGRWAQ